jgi:hypothetical protein
MNCSHQYLEWQIRDTTPSLRPEPLALDVDTPIEIIELFKNQDLSCVNMLWTSFLEKPNRVLEGWHFATMSETMIVQTPLGSIEAYNLHPIFAIHGDSQFLGALAKDMESYLEALLCGAMIGKHFSPGFADEPGVKEKLEPIAKLCSVIAGGDEYYDFWAGLLGL